jgi:hypothetical protein
MAKTVVKKAAAPAKKSATKSATGSAKPAAKKSTAKSLVKYNEAELLQRLQLHFGFDQFKGKQLEAAAKVCATSCRH